MTSEEPTTGEGLADEDQIYRRLLSEHLIYDQNRGQERPSSAAFGRRRNEEHASCYIHSLLIDNNLQPSDVLDGHVSMGLLQVSLAALRVHEMDARPDPNGVDPERPHKCDVAHGAIVEPSGKSKSAVKKLWGALASSEELAVVIRPPG